MTSTHCTTVVNLTKGMSHGIPQYIPTDFLRCPVSHSTMSVPIASLTLQTCDVHIDKVSWAL